MLTTKEALERAIKIADEAQREWDAAPAGMRAAAIETAPDLCKSLAAIAAFNLQDNPKAQAKIYTAVRHLQILADLPPMPVKE